MKVFGKEYEEIKHIPISRLWGYFDFLNRYYKSEDELIRDQQKKYKNVGNVDWDKEVKKLKSIKGK